MNTISQVVGIEKTSADFRRGLCGLAAEMGIDVDWLAAVISFETGGTFAPDVVVGGGRYRGAVDNRKAVGLIQFTGTALRAMAAYRPAWKTSKQLLAGMTATEQLVWVRRYFATVVRGRRLHNLGDVYMAVFAPVAIGRQDNTVLYREPSGAYEANRGLDTRGKGYITRGDAVRHVEAVLARGRKRGRIEVEPRPSEPARAEGGGANVDATFPGGSDGSGDPVDVEDDAVRSQCEIARQAYEVVAVAHGWIRWADLTPKAREEWLYMVEPFIDAMAPHVEAMTTLTRQWAERRKT